MKGALARRMWPDQRVARETDINPYTDEDTSPSPRCLDCRQLRSDGRFEKEIQATITRVWGEA